MGMIRMAKTPLVVISVAVIVLLTAIALFPSLFNGFVDWDDTAYVMENEAIRGFSAQNLTEIFTSGYTGSYCPLAIVSYAGEYHFFRLDPFVYHLTNYTLHIIITVLVFCFIYLLSRKVDIAFITSVLFGIHPLHVESVAWISERKDLLCALFYMLALIAYLIYLKRERISYYFLCFLFAIFALFSKAMAVTLPVILILLDYFCGRKINKRSILEKVPMFVLALIFGIINLHFQKLTGATKLVTDWGVKTYFFSKVILFYLLKLFVPVHLSAMYPYHNVTPANLSEIKYYIAILILLIVLVIVSVRRNKKVIFGSAFFIITIAPVLKMIPAGDVFAADRYMYLPSIGVLYIFSVLIDDLFYSRIGRLKPVKATVICAIFLLFLAFSALTWKRCEVWRNTEVLFMDVIKKYPDTPLPYNNIGIFYAEKGDMDTAIDYFNKALIVKPGYSLAKENRKRAYKKKEEISGEGEVLIDEQKEKDKDIPERVRLLNNLGIAEGRSGDLDEAISLFKEAIELYPGYAESYNNLGYAYYLKGEIKKAEGYFKKALEIDPDHEKARMNLDYIHSLEGIEIKTP